VNADDITGLAARHGIEDLAGLKEALRWARIALDLEADDAPDTLDEIDALAFRLLMLLDDQVNQRRIFNGLLDEFHPEYRERPYETPFELIAEVGHKFDEMLRRLDAVRLVARNAHHPPPGRGRPVTQHELRSAYGWLAAFWKRTFGEDRFKQDWEETPEGLEPLTDAARFLRDAMKIIDPRRPRLAQELRWLMQADIGKMRGPRQGRRGT
jgi:hypothetical protein